MTTGYVICTTPRSGSTLLCSMLAAMGNAGAPDSFFHRPDIMRDWALAWDLDADRATLDTFDRSYLAAAIDAGRGRGDRFAMRLRHQFRAPLTVRLGAIFPKVSSERALLATAFGPLRYIHLTRVGKLAQAVSLVRAEQTGLWHRNADGSERERTAPAASPHYDGVAIAAAMANIISADDDWKHWFAVQGIAPLTVTYENLAAAPAETVRMLCEAIGIEPIALSGSDQPTARLFDAVNKEWIDRFLIARDATSV